MSQSDWMDGEGKRWFRSRHAWDVSPPEACEIQKGLSVEVIAQDCLPRIHRVAGVDVGFREGGKTSRAAVAVLDYPMLQLTDYAVCDRPTAFPYVPGLLSFREVPAVLECLERLHRLPDLIICDGQGLAHPRRFGIACHLGVITAIPTIGLAKTRLIGTYSRVPEGRGQWVPLYDHGEVIGAVLRTRVRVKPVFVSIGHRISLRTAIDYVVSCTTRYRLPETTRWAHRLASGT